MSGSVPLARTIRSLEVLFILILAYHLARECFSIVPVWGNIDPWLEVLAVALLLLGMTVPGIKLFTSVILLVASLAVLVKNPGEVIGPVGVFVTSYALWHERFFFTRRRLLSGVLVVLIMTSLVLATVINERTRVFSLVVLALSFLAMMALIAIFRADLHVVHDRVLPSLDLSKLALSGRELQVLHLFWGGYKPKEIAFELKVADSTIRRLFVALYRKFEVDGAKELFLLCHTRRICLEGQFEPRDVSTPATSSQVSNKTILPTAASP